MTMTTTMNHFKIISLVAVFAGLVSGCVNLKAPSDPTRYYLLNGASAAEALADYANGSGPVVRLAPIELDPYLDSRYMVLRLQEFEVQFSDIHRWGEELTDNIRRAMARDLLATGAVSRSSRDPPMMPTSSSESTYTASKVYPRTSPIFQLRGRCSTPVATSCTPHCTKREIQAGFLKTTVTWQKNLMSHSKRWRKRSPTG